MAIERVQFDFNGTTYTLPINPIEYDDLEDHDIILKDTVDGTSLRYEPFFDGRPRIMRWKGLPNTTEFGDMVAQLKSRVDKPNIRINHRGLHRRGIVDFWRDIRIDAVEVDILSESSPRATSYLTIDLTLKFSYKRG